MEKFSCYNRNFEVVCESLILIAPNYFIGVNWAISTLENEFSWSINKHIWDYESKGRVWFMIGS